MKKIENLKNVKRVRFNDYSEYEPGKSSNGGHYGFWTDYTITENGEWEVSYGTTADFEFARFVESSETMKNGMKNHRNTFIPVEIFLV